MIIDSWGSPTLRHSGKIEIHTKYIKFINHIFVEKFNNTYQQNNNGPCF